MNKKKIEEEEKNLLKFNLIQLYYITIGMYKKKLKILNV